MNTTYSTLAELTAREVNEALNACELGDITDTDRAALPELVTAELQARGLVVFNDGYDVTGSSYHLDRQGFQLLIDPEDPSEFWNVVQDVVSAL